MLVWMIGTTKRLIKHGLTSDPVQETGSLE
jgi:hypothetical protein